MRAALPTGSLLYVLFLILNKRLWLIVLQTLELLWYTLIAGSLHNAYETWNRSRSYRLFEHDITNNPSKTSARLVKVQSAPSSPSVLGRFGEMLAPETAESRAHPDKTRDVWELSVWDPRPWRLRLFCLFSPGNALIYYIYLPLAPFDPRPSVSIFHIFLLQAIFSGFLLLLCSKFEQQTKDRDVISRETMHEYNAKFVQPRLNPEVREVGTQCSGVPPRGPGGFVEVNSPFTLVRRGFQTHPNPNYVAHTNTGIQETSTPQKATPPAQASVTGQRMYTPSAAARRSDASMMTFEPSSEMKRNLPFGYAAAPSPSLSTTPSNMGNRRSPEPSRSTSTNFGGHMGIYTHKNSPLKKATSMGDVSAPMPRNSREMAAYEQNRAYRSPSTTKNTEVRKSTGALPDAHPDSFAASIARNRNVPSHERYPSRRW